MQPSWNKNESTNNIVEPICPNKHELVKHVGLANHHMRKTSISCDVCSDVKLEKFSEENGYYRCNHECNYDICLVCYNFLRKDIVFTNVCIYGEQSSIDTFLGYVDLQIK